MCYYQKQYISNDEYHQQFKAKVELIDNYEGHIFEKFPTGEEMVAREKIGWKRNIGSIDVAWNRQTLKSRYDKLLAQNLQWAQISIQNAPKIWWIF